MAWFVSRIYPKTTDTKAAINCGLTAVATTLASKGEQAEADTALRMAAVSCDNK